MLETSRSADSRALVSRGPAAIRGTSGKSSPPILLRGARGNYRAFDGCDRRRQQKQADFVASAMAKVDNARVHDCTW